MTIDEAIQKHIRIADSYHKAMPNYDEAADHRQLAEWLMELKDLRAEQNEQYVFIRELMDELKEAKRLLKAAIEDMYNSVNDVHCKYCSKWHTDQCLGASHLDCYIENKFKWRYADEALKLIGED